MTGVLLEKPPVFKVRWAKQFSSGFKFVFMASAIVLSAPSPIYAKTCASQSVEGNGFDQGLPFLYRGKDRFKLARDARARGSYRAINDWKKNVHRKHPNYSTKWEDATEHFVACEFEEEADNDDSNDLETGWVKCRAVAAPCRDMLPNLGLQPKPRVTIRQ